MDNEPEIALKDIEKVFFLLGALQMIFSCFEKVLVTQPNDFHAVCTHAKVIYQVRNKPIHSETWQYYSL